VSALSETDIRGKVTVLDGGEDPPVRVTVFLGNVVVAEVVARLASNALSQHTSRVIVESLHAELVRHFEAIRGGRG
jgi:hypothetical protein